MSATLVESSKQFTSDIPDEPVMHMSQLGKGLALKNRKIAELSNVEAIRLLELPEFMADRALDNKHVVFLTRQMDAGNFRWEQVHIITCLLDGKEYRMNGQHTCWARTYATNVKTAKVEFLEYEAKTDSDMRQLYSSIDRGKARTNANVVIANLYGREEFKQLNKKTIKILAEGIAFWLWDTDDQRQLHQGDDRSYMMLTDYYPLTTRVGNFLNMLKIAEAKHVWRRPVISAMYATFDKAPEIALAFWKSIVNGDMIPKGDPRLTLRNELIRSSIAAGGTGSTSKDNCVSSEEMYRWCLAAWKAHRDNSTLQSFRVQLDKPRIGVK